VHDKHGGEQSGLVHTWCCQNLNMAVPMTEHIKSKAQTRVWARSFNNTVLTAGAIKNSRNVTNAPLAVWIAAAKRTLNAARNELYASPIPLISCATYIYELSITDCTKCTKSVSRRQRKFCQVASILKQPPTNIMHLSICNLMSLHNFIRFN
jgi:pullulanase/glycogen debranching enzyme